MECISDGRRIDVNVCSQFSEPPPTEETCEAVFPGRNCRDLNPRWSIGSWTKVGCTVQAPSLNGCPFVVLILLLLL